jgi:hypothetical protein
MPLGLGAQDTNGQWQYGELDDAGGLASDLLALGQSRVSSGFAADRARLATIETLIQKMPRLIRSETFTNVSTVTVDGLTGFDEYTITLDIPISSVANTLGVVVRADGVDNTALLYDRQLIVATGATAVGATLSAQSSWATVGGTNRTDHRVVLKVANLNASRRTIAEVTYQGFDASGATAASFSAFRHRAVTAFNGLGVKATAGTITGTLTVVGVSLS